MEERKFVCKYCNKKYPCGKSLGGHIRTHMINEHSSHQSKEVNKINNADHSVAKFDVGRKKRKRDFGSEEAASGGNPIFYGLRENPKKTTRFVHNNSNVVVKKQQEEEERFCKECGKGFLSLKALCGHMACHSEKDKGMKMTTKKKKKNKFENNSGFSMKQKLVVDDSQSDTDDDETSSAPNHHPRSSRRMRFKTVNTDNKNNQPCFVSSFGNGSSSVSEVEQEQEEIARCLMLLSKDSSHRRGRFVLPTESSDNNSVVVEAKSPSLDKIITLKNGQKSCVSNGCEMVKEMKVEQCNNNSSSMKLKSAEIVDSDNSDSGYFRNGPEQLGFSIDGYNRNGEFKTPKVEVMSGCEFDQSYDAELRKKMLISNRGRTRGTTEPRKLILKDLDNKTTDGLAREDFINWRKRPRYDSLCQNNSVGVSCKRTPNGLHNEQPLKKSKSLTSEKIINGSQDSADESDESCTNTDAYTAPRPHSSSRVINAKKDGKFKKKMKSKKSRDHECPICYKNFKSGQALGGHKRSHFVGGSEENNTVVIQQVPPVVPFLFDLNLPAPIDD